MALFCLWFYSSLEFLNQKKLKNKMFKIINPTTNKEAEQARQVEQMKLPEQAEQAEQVRRAERV
jgi:hypothetical protein